MENAGQEVISVLDDEAAYRALVDSIEAPLVAIAKLTPESVVSYRVEIGQLLIEEDIARGVLPADLSCFSDAHDYMDANMYLLDEGHPVPVLGSFYEWDSMDTGQIIEHFGAVSDALNAWLVGGRKGKALDHLT